MPKVKVTRLHDDLPRGTNVGDEIDIGDSQLQQLQSGGYVERITASNQPQPGGDRLTRPSMGADANTGAPRQGNAPKASDADQKAEYDRVNQQRDRQNERMQRDNSNR